MLEANGIPLDDLNSHWSPHARYSTTVVAIDVAAQFVQMAASITAYIDGIE